VVVVPWVGMAWTRTVGGVDCAEEVEGSRCPRGRDPGDCHGWWRDYER
jgi:hypothetical protein